MMNKILSKYIEKIPYGEQTILFNKINGGIVLFENNKFFERDIDNDSYIIDCPKEDYESLQKNGFFINDNEIRKYIKNNLCFASIENKLSIIISVTEECNLSCDYCYQRDWNKTEKIHKSEYTKMVLDYIERVLLTTAPEIMVLNIYYIGGEPLLQKEMILFLTKEIKEIASFHKNIELRFHMDSNIILLTPDFITKFPNLEINTTLSLPTDHNIHRSNSFNAVLNALEGVRELFENENYKLIIRYNFHHHNEKELKKFLDFIKGINLKCSVDVQNTMNVECSNFQNLITDDEFDKKYVADIIPLLLQYNIDSSILPQYGLSRHCLGSGKYNCKFYANGEKTLCDAFSKTNGATKSSEFHKLPEICIQCFDFPYCGGIKPCDTQKCDGKYYRKENVRSKIVAYVNNISQKN